MYILADFENMTKKVLRDLLVKASDSYYNSAESIISDEEFDIGFKYFTAKYPNDELNKQIGAKIKTSEWKKALHKIRMCSLNKANTAEEFHKWASTILDKFYIIMDKCDGISIAMEYENGELVKAITRGDGIEGEDIYKNVINMKNVKMTIPNFTGSIRGEIVMFVTDFEQLNVILKEKGEKEHSNPRNTAAGVAKRFDGNNTEFLTVLYYDATGKWETEEQKLNWLNSQGLKTCFWTKCDIHHCQDYYEEYEKHLRAETPYDVDGLVIKANSIALQDKLGLLGENPRAQIAWKFTSMKAETTLLDIDWQVGANRRITPVAVLEPIKVGGVIVRKASLHNLRYFNDLMPYKNARVLISRRGDVIPQIEKIIE